MQYNQHKGGAQKGDWNSKGFQGKGWGSSAGANWGYAGQQPYGGQSAPRDGASTHLRATMKKMGWTPMKNWSGDLVSAGRM